MHPAAPNRTMEAPMAKWVNVDYSQRVADPNNPPPRQQSMADGDYSQQRRSSSSSSLRSSSNSTRTSGAFGYAAGIGSSHPLDPNDEQFIQITVCEPMKQGEGMNAYISYKINTTTNRPQFTKSELSVIRRYSDFIWLHASLAAKYSGVVVPPLPEKLLVGRFSEAFIESRRRALQAFLQRCSMHPELQHSEHLTAFLEANDEALTQFKADPKYAVAKGARGSIFQWIDDTVNTISTTLGASASVHLEKTAADIEVEEMVNYIDGLEPIMTGLHKHANGLTKRAREIADALCDFGVAYSLLGKSEENPSLQIALREIAGCAERLSEMSAQYAEKEAIDFEKPILDYVRLVGAVKAALQKRDEVRVSYGMAVADLDAKTAIVQKLTKNRSVSDEKFQLANADVINAQERVDDAKLNFDVVTERVMREVERFKREKLADFKQIILDYVQLQIAHSKMVEKEWSQVIEKLSQVYVDSPSASLQSIASNASGPLSMIQENYIPSTGAAVAGEAGGSRHGSGGDLSNNLLSLSLDEEGEEEQKAAWDSQRTRVTRVQVRSSSSSSSPYYNPDLTL